MIEFMYYLIFTILVVSQSLECDSFLKELLVYLFTFLLVNCITFCLIHSQRFSCCVVFIAEGI